MRQKKRRRLATPFARLTSETEKPPSHSFSPLSLNIHGVVSDSPHGISNSVRAFPENSVVLSSKTTVSSILVADRNGEPLARVALLANSSSNDGLRYV